MRKIVCLLTSISSIAILLLSMNQTFINRVKHDRYFDHLNSPSTYNNSLYYRLFIRSDRWGYGDLYGLCYLPEYKYKLERYKKYNRESAKKPTDRILYIIGDSFLADKSLGGAFDGFDNVVFLDRRFPFGPITLDSTKQNYLLMEFVERNLNDYDLHDTEEIKWTKNDIKAKLNFNTKINISQPDLKLPTTILARINKAIFNKDLSRNLELLLFEDKIFTPVKELKAFINYKLLRRLPKEVAVSNDKKRLLLNITVDTGNMQSAFRIKSDQQINKIDSNLAIAQSYYQSIGFKKVFLSVIPNPVSIYDYKRMPYNHLLERIEKKTNLALISVYNTFKTDKQNLYYLSDAHWNPTGFDIWITKTNKILKARD
ncbi:MAG: hypothetical protein JWQ66_2651 [Mucilaginibacter sp.]|nr:hypothetical protein [Mucilaginibacter sp.]